MSITRFGEHVLDRRIKKQIKKLLEELPQKKIILVSLNSEKTFEDLLVLNNHEKFYLLHFPDGVIKNIYLTGIKNWKVLLEDPEARHVKVVKTPFNFKKGNHLKFSVGEGTENIQVYIEIILEYTNDKTGLN